MNASLPMVVTLFGIKILCKLEQTANAFETILVKSTLVGRVALVKAVQPWNACVPRVRTLFGITILVRAEQLKNAVAPMLVTPVPIVALANKVQPWNAD
jgi:hypothetical protein